MDTTVKVVAIAMAGWPNSVTACGGMCRVDQTMLNSCEISQS